jgi:hypothetical protein
MFSMFFRRLHCRIDLSAINNITKLLNKDLELWLCYEGFNTKLKKPPGSGNEHNIMAFDKIGKRAVAPKLVVNYALGDDYGLEF